MKRKRACLIINPRTGKNVARISEVLAVLAAAGWHTDVALKEYGRHALKLASRAAEQEYDLVIAYGGDGTLNQVINGVMNVKGQHSVVGIIPGGTANQWAFELGIPVDPVKAALTLVNSYERCVDIGHVEVEMLTFPEVAQAHQKRPGRKKILRKANPRSYARHHFLLTAGLGFDAAVISQVNKPLKYRIGRAAFGVATAQKLPDQHPFPLELRTDGSGSNGKLRWRGDGVQVILANSRRYADVVELTPDAYIDDGMMDVCIIASGNPLENMQQITSLLLLRKPDDGTAEYFQGTHFSLRLPASIAMHLDGSATALKDYLSDADCAALQRAGDAAQVMVDYRFEMMPHALRMAVPYTYDGTLFKMAMHRGKVYFTPAKPASEETYPALETSAQTAQEDMKILLEHGRNVLVAGVAPNPEKKDSYIIAGSTLQQQTGEVKPVAVRVGGDTVTMLKRTGEHVSAGVVQDLQEGMVMVIEGKKSRRGVIHATHIVV